jgi:LPS-assembly lipoprotein
MCPAASSTSLSRPPARRAVLVAGLGAVVGACGFRPLHAPPQAGATPLAVRVALIPDRNGQVLRQELSRRLGEGGPALYELRVALSAADEALGFRRDGAASRVRVVYRAEWRLVTLASPVREVMSGADRVLDAYNLADEQFFATDASRLAAERRMMELLADQIATQLRARVAAA